MLLEGKTAFITGGARGIGAASAHLMVGEGAKVAIADRRAEEAAETVAALNALRPDSAVFVPLDLNSDAGWVEALKQAEALLGPTSILVNNAAINRVAALDQMSLEN